MAKIIPAILENTKIGFLEKLSLVTKIPEIERIQVDFGDGQFIENKLLDISNIDTLNPIIHFEAHLMVKNPTDFLDYKICGFKTIIIHFEAFQSDVDLKYALEKIKNLGLRASVAINPDTPVNVLKDIQADQYLIMSVTPGKQGQIFLASTLNKIKDLRQMFPYAIIEVDGGVNETNIKSIKEAGADLICVGSALVKAQDMNLAYTHLEMSLSSS